MAVKRLTNVRPQFVDGNGVPLSGALLFFYVAGSSTRQDTFNSSSGLVANSNPIQLDSSGRPTTEIWLTVGVTYKFVFANVGDGDSITNPSAPIWTEDNITGINDVTVDGTSEWIAGPAPTYISSTSFSLVGDQTSLFQVGRAVKIIDAGGTKYGWIKSSSFTTLTTIVLDANSSTLASPLSSVSYGLLSASNPSIPNFLDSVTQFQNAADLTKKLKISLAGQTTGVTRNLSTQDQDVRIGSVARAHLAGLTMSTAGSSATMSIASGQATDSTNIMMMELASAIAKTTSAWAVGSTNGGLDTGSIANNTWYHFYLIMRRDTGVVDVVFSTNATSPTLPANYTLFRRIGSGLTNSSAQWVSFIQDGDLFQWLVPVANVSSTNPGATAITPTLTTPLGLNVTAYLSALLVSGTTSSLALFLSDPAITNSTPDTVTFFSLVGATGAGGQNTAGEFYIRTNTSSQIRYRLSASGVADIVRIATKGWIDTRGKNA